ncbi:DNA-directed RNA polymerases I and III subunit RPAC2 [Sarcoptes scabiei]|uniref:DNA-directed RNA polymerase I subunit D n=1 Tax=Sarcoptes scabiei TaxID=52283 RepID=A0A132AIB7_SARSC|nr:DNA-directed RNA polymerases I and III subunit RPAC2 [Sarcoptes scabiei]KPM10734.1 DNA-directed RNA polymerases I and III subunit RPAC2-like protein [Sarcoptes scabiei]
MSTNDFEIIEINDDETCGTFKFFNEDHTLANLLRHQILMNPLVNFCGYSIPHPSEEYFQMQIQTKKGFSPYQALRDGLEAIIKLADNVEKLFTEAVDKYHAERERN